MEQWQQWRKYPLAEELLPLGQQVLGADILSDLEHVLHSVGDIRHQLTHRQGEYLYRDRAHQLRLTLIYRL